MIYQGVRCHAVMDEPWRFTGSACIIIQKSASLLRAHLKNFGFETELKSIGEQASIFPVPQPPTVTADGNSVSLFFFQIFPQADSQLFWFLGGGKC